MKYGDKVRVKSGFYEGSEFIVIAQCPIAMNITHTKRYAIADNNGPVKYLNYDLQLELQTFEESDLELIK